MNIVISGGRVQVYGEDVKTYKTIPIGSYDVCFNKMMGFYMVSRPDLEAREDKIYGSHVEKVNKVMRAYDALDRNIGIILSGQKGAGKSLFARILAEKAIERGMPVITVTMAYPGVADFLASIEQEVVVIFDEFEKTFGKHDDFDPQEDMLSLFDGMDNGKKMFVITCNEVNKLNPYLINRPGRFHYHFVISSPTADEVRQYMTDKLSIEYHQFIDRIVGFSNTVNITYDYLRAIAFELNMGYSLEETLNDLNIMRTKDINFDVIFRFTNGQVYQCYGKNLDLYSNEQVWCRAYGGKDMPCTTINFVPSDVKFIGDKLYIPVEKVTHEIDSDEYWELEEDEKIARQNSANARVLESVELKKISNDYINRYSI